MTAAPLLAAASCAAPARADYAVLRSGLRLHITGYESEGAHVRLTVEGGTVDVQAEDVVAIEPEDHFTPNAPSPVTSAGPFANLIHAAAQKHGLDEDLIARVIAMESNFNPRAVSRKQALGLMQLLPQTAARYSVGDIFDPAQNIDAGAHYLKDLLTRYRGNLALALAAYNAGPEMVERYGGVPPFAETQNYVRQITDKMARAKSVTAKN
ncbi:MAG: lytic transglycosylase domain-containing protein [Candidatus Acidiferrales bacterium]